MMNWLEILAAPLLYTVLGGIISGIIIWYIKSKIEELQAIEKKVREERRKIYTEILEPFVILFSGSTNNISDAIDKVKSRDYRRAFFELNLIGSDEVVKANNELFQYIYEIERTGERNTEKMMGLWANLLYEIRKDLGYQKTDLDKEDMLRAMIKDIDQYQIE